MNINALTVVLIIMILGFVVVSVIVLLVILQLKKIQKENSNIIDGIKTLFVEFTETVANSDNSFNNNFKNVGDKLTVLEDRQITMKDVIANIDKAIFNYHRNTISEIKRLKTPNKAKQSYNKRKRYNTNDDIQ